MRKPQATPLAGELAAGPTDGALPAEQPNLLPLTYLVASLPPLGLKFLIKSSTRCTSAFFG
jgi:hypothetical protein